MIKLLYEDREVIVAVKPVGVISESAADGSGFADLLSVQTQSSYIGVVHRLDQNVGGVMVYAKTARAAAELSRATTEGKLQKSYLALVHGCPTPSTGELRDLLFYDRMQGKSFVVERQRKGAKEAILHYEVLKTKDIAPDRPASLLRIHLITGRTHQIRVQFSSRHYPLLGDRKYGAPEGGAPALFCHALRFSHPVTKKPMEFSEIPDERFSDWL